MEARLAECRLDWNAPTLLLFECVLVYVAAGGASALLRGLAQRFSTAFCVNYEQVGVPSLADDVIGGQSRDGQGLPSQDSVHLFKTTREHSRLTGVFFEWTHQSDGTLLYGLFLVDDVNEGQSGDRKGSLSQGRVHVLHQLGNDLNRPQVSFNGPINGRVALFVASYWLMTSLEANQEVGKGRHLKKVPTFSID